MRPLLAAAFFLLLAILPLGACRADDPSQAYAPATASRPNPLQAGGGGGGGGGM